MALAITLHLLAAVIWVGGMFFAYIVLRPAAAQLLEPPLRLKLWTEVFKRFFPWVWVAVLILLATGLWMVFGALGGMAAVGMSVHTMLLLGLVMMLIFLHIYFAPFRRLQHAVNANAWQEGSAQLNRIRQLVGINLCLGLFVAGIAVLGRYLS